MKGGTYEQLITAVMEGYNNVVHLLTLLQNYYAIATVHVLLQDSPGDV